MKNIMRFCLFLIVILVFSNNPVNAIEKKINVKLLNQFRIELKSNPTTGYDWNITNINQKHFKIIKSGYNAPKTTLVGAGGVRWWQIKALKSGKSIIILQYYRPWEGTKEAVDKCVYNANVR